MIQRKNADREWMEFLSAQIAAAVINFSMCHPEKRVDESSLMPSRHKPRPRQTQEQITRSLDLYFHGLRVHQERGGK